MNKVINTIIIWSKKLIPVFGCITLFLIILQRLGLDRWILLIYHALIPIFVGGVITFFLQPFINRLHRYISYKMSVYIIYFGFVIFFIGILLFALPEIYKYGNTVVTMFPIWMREIEQLLEKHQISFQYQDIINQPYVKEGYNIVIQSIRDVIEKVGIYGFGYMIAFFISLDIPFFKKIMQYYDIYKCTYTKFYQTICNIVFQYVKGTLVDMIFIVVSVGVILYIFGFSNPWVYAILLSLLNLFPYIGATVGVFLIALAAYFKYSSFPWLLIISVWIVQQIEANVIQPFIFHRTMHVHPLLIFIFMFLGNAIFGIIGIILSPILAASFQMVLGSYFHVKTKDTVGEWNDVWEDFDQAMNKEDNKM